MQERLKLTPAAAAQHISKQALSKAADLQRRILVGIAGGPGSGKSTLAAAVIGHLNATVDGSAARVPMDGFHMKQAKLEAAELEAFKGAPHTFEAEAFVKTLTQLKSARHEMAVPGYSRKIEDVIPDAFHISGNVPILVVEGNYLLLNSEPWLQVRKMLDLSFYIDVRVDLIRTRLLKRHAEHGRFTEEQIRKHVSKVDMINYIAVSESSKFADAHIEMDTKE